MTSSVASYRRAARISAAAMAIVLACTPLRAADPLAEGFREPPPLARPLTWWHWMNGNVNRAGITTDLEAIRAAGLGGAHLFNVGLDVPRGDVTFMSPEWRELLAHSARECERLGLEFSVHTTDGWSQSGGTWITPDLAMQKVTTAELRVDRAGPATLRLPTPPTVQGYYKDIAVLAFPTPPEDVETQAALGPKITTDVPRLTDVEERTPPGSIALPKPTADSPRTATWSFERPFTARSLAFGFRTADGPAEAMLEASDDGENFRAVGKLPTPAESFSFDHFTTWAFPAVTARHFRVKVIKGGRLPNLVFRLTLHSGDRVDRYENKAGDAPRESTTAWSDRTAAPRSAVDPKLIVDLTDRLRPDGTLDWDVPVPPGDSRQWTVLRVGHTLTGRTNQAATDAGRGLECDKLNPDAVRFHFESFAAKILDDNRDRIGRSIHTLHLDSWEALCQNWTPRMREEFTRLRGYDPRPYYPVLTGRIVTSLEVSERFLYDLRRTVADLIRDHHFRLLTKLCNERGIKLTAEATGPNMPTIAHGLESKAVVDIPMGEFWVGREIRADCKEAAASAHVHGKSVVPAEAFTAVRGDFTDDFYSMKPLGDAAFAAGINRFVFHRFVHQPWPDRAPGMGMGPYGINFDRTNTWWPQVRVWTDYVARCQFLLQQGAAVSDVLYYTGENVPHMLPPRRELRPELPDGWDYDACSADDLVTLSADAAGAAGSRLRSVVFPSGARYRVIVLPDTPFMTPRVLEKIAALVEGGAVVVGPRPLRSPSLAGYPGCDEHVREVAIRLWGEGDGRAATRRDVGAGRVYSGVPLAEVLAELGVQRDTEVIPAAATSNGPTEAPALKIIHRRAGTDEIYFVANPVMLPVEVTVRFRDAGGTAELWDPATGRVTLPQVAERAAGGGAVGADVTLRLDPCGSTFVLFRKANAARVTLAGPDAGALLERSGTGLALTTTTPGRYVVTTATSAGAEKRRTVTVPELVGPTTLGGPWAVTFEPPTPKLGAKFAATLPELTSWHLHADAAVRGFSGTGTYTVRFTRPESADGQPLFLDLGKVKNLARVVLNGQDLGVVWKPPFRVELSSALKPGENTLEIRVTNLWPNRLIADAALPPEARGSFTTTNYYQPETPLLESGLLGPARLIPGYRAGLTH